MKQDLLQPWIEITLVPAEDIAQYPRLAVCQLYRLSIPVIALQITTAQAPQEPYLTAVVEYNETLKLVHQKCPIKLSSLLIETCYPMSSNQELYRKLFRRPSKGVSLVPMV